MRRQDYAPHHVEPAKVRDAKAAAALESYPSTRFDADDWYAVLQVDDGLFQHILADIARFTRLRRERGRLHLDRSGREIPEGEQ